MISAYFIVQSRCAVAFLLLCVGQTVYGALIWQGVSSLAQHKGLNVQVCDQLYCDIVKIVCIMA